MNNSATIFTILEKIPLFKDLSEESYKIIMANVTLEYYPANHKIFSQGDNGDAMYIIKKGLVKIYRGQEGSDDEVVIATLGDNSFFGEMALVEELPRNANAKTLKESEIFILKKEDFHKIIAQNPSLAEQISSEFIHRIKQNMRNEKFNDIQ
jgi:CRP-like cAMP-binding protein